MEALGSAASVFAAVSVADQLADRVKQLYDFWSAVSDAPEKIRSIASDLNLLSSVIVQIANHEQSSGVDDLTTETLKRCSDQVLNLLTITTGLEKSLSSTSRRMRKWGAIKAVFKDEKISTFRMELDRIKSTLMLTRIDALSQSSSSHFENQQQSTARILGGLSDLAITYASTPSESDITKCIQSLYVADYSSKLDAIDTREPGTCEWILKHPSFLEWRASISTKLLWLSGNPGCGKTVISSFLINYLVHQQDGTVIYFICDNKDVNLRSKECVLKSILHQLLSAHPNLACHAIQKLQHTGDLLSIATLWTIFEEVLRDQRVPLIYLVIDGLDECEDESRKWLLNKLGAVVSKATGSCRLEFPAAFKVIVTSRPWDDIEYALGKMSRLRLKTEGDENINNDIAKFVNTQVHNLAERRGYPAKLKENVIHTLTTNANGMFLWVSLLVNDLEAVPVRNVQKHLEALPRTLYELYERILAKINPAAVDRVQHILTWIVTAIRPLELKELAIASELDTMEGLQGFTMEELLQLIKGDINLCGPILTIRGQRVHLVHQSAKDFFLGNHQHLDTTATIYQVEPATSNARVASDCLRYLCSTDFGTSVVPPSGCSRDKFHEKIVCNVRSRLDDFPFLEYSTKYWPKHFQQSGNHQIELMTVVRQLLKKANTISTCFHVNLYLDMEHYFHRSSCFGGAVFHYLAYLGSESILEMALADLEKNEENVSETKSRAAGKLDERNYGGETPLLWTLALIKGGRYIDEHDRHAKHAIFMLLVSAGASLESKNRLGERALHISCRMKSSDLAKALINAGADVHSRDTRGCTPFHFVSMVYERRGRQKILDFQLLLDHGAQIDAINLKGQTALHLAIIASENGLVHTSLTIAEIDICSVVEYLANAGADLNIKDGAGNTPLLLALQMKTWEVIFTLLSHGSEIKIAKNDRESVFSLAIKSGNSSVTQAIIQACKGLQREEITRWANIAAADGQEEAVKSLNNLIDGSENTQSLLTARLVKSVKTGNIPTSRQLLQQNAVYNIGTEDSNGRTIIHHAVEGRDLSMVELVADKIQLFNTVDCSGRTPLQFAVAHGDLDIVTLLLNKGANVNINRATEFRAATALHVAAHHGHVSIAQLLIDQGAIIDAEDWRRATPLLSASMNGHRVIVELLLQNGAFVDHKDAQEKTGLLLAAQYGHQTTVEYLLQNGANSFKDKIGWYPIHLTIISEAAFLCGCEIVQLLISYDSSTIEAQDWQGRTPLQLAVGFFKRGQQSRNKDIIQFLLEKGADINTKDKAGSTLLHTVVKSRRPEVIWLLLKHGADFRIKDRSGLTAFELIMELRDDSLTDYLLSLDNNVRERELMTDLSVRG